MNPETITHCDMGHRAGEDVGASRWVRSVGGRCAGGARLLSLLFFTIGVVEVKQGELHPGDVYRLASVVPHKLEPETESVNRAWVGTLVGPVQVDLPEGPCAINSLDGIPLVPPICWIFLTKEAGKHVSAGQVQPLNGEAKACGARYSKRRKRGRPFPRVTPAVTAGHHVGVACGGLDDEVDGRPVLASALNVGDISEDCASATRWSVRQAALSGRLLGQRTHVCRAFIIEHLTLALWHPVWH